MMRMKIYMSNSIFKNIRIYVQENIFSTVNSAHSHCRQALPRRAKFRDKWLPTPKLDGALRYLDCELHPPDQVPPFLEIFKIEFKSTNQWKVLNLITETMAQK